MRRKYQWLSPTISAGIVLQISRDEPEPIYYNWSCWHCLISIFQMWMLAWINGFDKLNSKLKRQGFKGDCHLWRAEVIDRSDDTGGKSKTPCLLRSRLDSRGLLTTDPDSLLSETLSLRKIRHTSHIRHIRGSCRTSIRGLGSCQCPNPIQTKRWSGYTVASLENNATSHGHADLRSRLNLRVAKSQNTELVTPEPPLG